MEFCVLGPENTPTPYMSPPLDCKLMIIFIFLYTLVRLIMTDNIVVGKNNGGYKYGGIAEILPNSTRHYFTCNIIFTKFFVNPPNFACHIAKFYPILFPDCVFVCSFKVK